MSAFINSILALYKNKGNEPPPGQWSSQRLARHWVNSLLLAAVVFMLVIFLIIIIVLFSAVGSIF